MKLCGSWIFAARCWVRFQQAKLHCSFSIWQWRRYTYQGATGPGWNIYRSDSRPGSALPGAAYCFALCEQKIKMLPYDLTALFVLLWRPVFWGRQLKTKVNLFWGKKCIRVTWLEDILSSKWPGSFTVLVPSLIFYYVWLFLDLLSLCSFFV